MTKIKLVLFFVFCTFLNKNYASTVSSNAVTGTFSDPASWASGNVPGSTDSVIIVAGANITLDINTTVAKLSINSTASFDLDTYTLRLIGKADSSYAGRCVINHS